MASAALLKALDEFGVTEEYVPYMQRYFSRGYAIDLKGQHGEDQCVLQHSNKICVVCLAPSHPVVRKTEIDVTKVNYRVNERLDRTENKVVGKRKRGAQWLNPLSPLCIISCSDGSEYTAYRWKTLMIKVKTINRQTDRQTRGCSKPVVHLTCVLCSCIRSSLLEINDQLLVSPNLLKEAVSYNLIV